MVPAVFYTETRHVHKLSLEICVAALAVVMGLMPLASHSFAATMVVFVVFFIAFNILEALQPSMVSRISPPEHKGLALGFYNMSQALGVAAGGAIGGLVARYAGPSQVFLLCSLLAASWFLISRGLKVSRR